MSKPSTYHELEVIGHGEDVERAGLSNDGRERREAANEPALHQQFLGTSELAQSSAHAVTAGASHEAQVADLWEGGGILKTVKMERTETSAQKPSELLARPPKLVLPSEHSQWI